MLRRGWFFQGALPGLLVAVCLVSPTLAQRVGRAEGASAAAVDQAEALSDAFHQAADEVLPTVVKIRSTVKQRVVRGRRGAAENPFRGTPFEDFFGEEGMPEGFGVPFEQRSPARQGTGSGVIIGADGLILTNNHVVADADEVVVELADGRKFPAVDIRTDPKTDLAVVRIKGAEGLKAARLGDSDKTEIGDWVLAIGNPFELEASVSAGIISAKGRSLGSAERAQFLQTDAAINPGNSGGPLINLHGEVVGINTAIASSSGGYQGIGFAIPINLAKWVIDQLVQSGTVSRAYLGIGIEQVTADVAETLGLPSETRGVWVREVREGAPAEKAGVRVDDVITHFAETPVSGPGELQRVVERAELGSRQELRLIRDGKPLTLSVTTESLPDEKKPDAEISEDEESDSTSGAAETKLGVQLADLTPELASQLDLPAGVEGVLVARVAPDGLAREAGLQRGMVIVGLNGESITDVASFENAFGAASLERGIRLKVRIPGEGVRSIVIKQR